MTDSIEWLRLLIVNHNSLEYIIIFIGTALGGELALFILGFLVAQNIVSIVPATIFGFTGSFLPNILWFLLGNINAVEKIASYRYTNSTFLIITEAVERVSKGSHLLAIILIKFLVGTPVLLIMYTQKTAIKFKQFMYYQSVAMILSMLIIVPTGYISGRGFSYISNLFENLYASFGFLLLIIFLITMFQIWLEKRFTNIAK